ncbi:MAG: hypothetical protein GXP27_02545 [Planctomycetes bacterium]|nr:hypothetical protein [Planctomycetota bacterium]
MTSANDATACVAPLRVLYGGGYEGERAIVYYGQPTVWSEDVEEHIIRTVHHQAEQLRFVVGVR